MTKTMIIPIMQELVTTISDNGRISNNNNSNSNNNDSQIEQHGEKET